VPKDAGKTGMTRTDVIQKCNEELHKAGYPPAFIEIVDSPLVETIGQVLFMSEGGTMSAPKTKWQVVHAFGKLNDATQIPNFQPGDLREKQRKMAGQRYILVCDFASGYFALAMNDDVIPFTAFHVDGRGYYIYLRMPMGLTGAPTMYCEMVVAAMGDMLGRELENWMDDVAFANQDFKSHFGVLEGFLSKCRVSRLSIAPQKMKLFQTEALFAGANLSTERIKPNLNRVAAIIEFPQPKTIHEALRFTGMTNSFRTLIRGYAKIAAPLTDLTRNTKREAEAELRAQTAKTGKAP
jgi:hypothetical protein